MANGQVKNHSSKALWVVETDSGPAVAHKLAAGRQSPSPVDADGFKAVDGTPIDGHTSWVKIVNWSTADVANDGQQLTRGCILCSSVGENEFGQVNFDQSPNWGEPISESGAQPFDVSLTIRQKETKVQKPKVDVKRIEQTSDGFELDIRVSFGGTEGAEKGGQGEAGFTSSCSCSCATCSCTCTCGTCSCTCSCATCQCTDGPSCPAC